MTVRTVRPDSPPASFNDWQQQIRKALLKTQYPAQDIVSSCCGARTYSPDDESFTCMDCKEPCEPYDLNKDE